MFMLYNLGHISNILIPFSSYKIQQFIVLCPNMDLQTISSSQLYGKSSGPTDNFSEIMKFPFILQNISHQPVVFENTDIVRISPVSKHLL